MHVLLSDKQREGRELSCIYFFLIVFSSTVFHILGRHFWSPTPQRKCSMREQRGDCKEFYDLILKVTCRYFCIFYLQKNQVTKSSLHSKEEYKKYKNCGHILKPQQSVCRKYDLMFFPSVYSYFDMQLTNKVRLRV